MEEEIKEEVSVENTHPLDDEEVVEVVTEDGTIPLTPEQQEAKDRFEANEKFQEQRIDAIIGVCREKILPVLNKNNESVEDSKRTLDTLAVTVQQGLFLIMKATKVAELELKEKISPTYPDYEKFMELIELLNEETMENTVEALQWMSQKIDAMIKAETKERAFTDLGIDF